MSGRQGKPRGSTRGPNSSASSLSAWPVAEDSDIGGIGLAELAVDVTGRGVAWSDL